MNFLYINSECLHLYSSGILENCLLEFQSNIEAADKIETTPDKEYGHASSVLTVSLYCCKRLSSK